jgi:Arc/MetJ-type ribon-helix-helix transcriptional regulator
MSPIGVLRDDLFLAEGADVALIQGQHDGDDDGRGLAKASAAAISEYDKCMKRITVSLPDELAEKVRRAAGGERRVSSYVAAALEDYAERENLAEVLAGWNAETAVPEEIQRQVRDELDRAGLTSGAGRDDRLAG